MNETWVGIGLDTQDLNNANHNVAGIPPDAPNGSLFNEENCMDTCIPFPAETQPHLCVNSTLYSRSKRSSVDKPGGPGSIVDLLRFSVPLVGREGGYRYSHLDSESRSSAGDVR